MPEFTIKPLQLAACLLRCWLIMLVAAVCPLYLQAQVLAFEPYTVKDGLLSNDILSITQDSRGYLWIGTRDGVSIFDGKEFENLTTADGLPSSLIWGIVEDRSPSSQSFWLLGSQGRLARWIHGRCVQFNYDSVFSWTGRVTSLCMDATGILWAGTEDTLVQIVQGRIRPVRSGTSIRYPHLIKEQGDSILWIASRSGLFRYSAGDGAFSRISLGTLRSEAVNALLFDEDGAVWAGFKDGYIIRIEQTRVVGKRRTEPFGFLVRDEDRSFWFGSYRGLYRMTNPLSRHSHVEHFTVENGLSENTLREGFVDTEGNVWLGGIAQGLVKLSANRLVRFPMRDINPPYQYSVGASDCNSHIWVVARSGLWEFWRGEANEWRYARHAGLAGRGTAPPFSVFDIRSTANQEARPYSLYCARDSILWIVFSNAQIVGYAIRHGRRGPSSLIPLKILRAGREVPHEFPKSMIVDHRGLLWFGTNRRIVLLDPRRPQPELRSFSEAPPSRGVNSTRVLFEDRSGSIWAGFQDGGVMRLDVDSLHRGRFSAVPVPGGNSGDVVAAICQDSLGRVWIATEGRGLLVGSSAGMIRLTVNDGLPSNTILSLTAEAGGKIWCGSSNGISYIEGVDPSTAMEPSVFRGEFSVQSGITRDGLMWFTGRSGLLVSPRNNERARIPPPVVSIRSLQANGRDLDPGVHHQLPYTENTCVVGFVAPTFNDPALLEYQFRMVNLDTAWSLPQRQGRVTYARLLPGEYTFEVRANVLGSPAPSRSAVLRFTIASPFWKSGWFTTALSLVLIAGIAGTIRHIEKRKMLARVRALELQQILDRERLRISRDMHDEVGSALTEITYLSERARQKPEDATSYVGEIASKASDVIDSVGEIVWAMNPNNDTLDNLLAHVRRHSVQYLHLAGIACRVAMPEAIPSLRVLGEVRRNVFLVVKEALHNVVRHSRATEVELSVTVENLGVEISIQDNGCGSAGVDRAGSGHGLENMRKRLESIDGRFFTQAEAGRGTRVTMCFTVSAERLA